MKKVLITGISGFAGSHLAEYLVHHDFSVSGLVRDASSVPFLSHIHDKITLYEGDLLDSQSVQSIFSKQEFDLIFHLAAFASPSESFKKSAEYLTNNISGELNVLETARQKRPDAKILIVSSAEVYGKVSEKDLPIDEDVSLNPTSPYAVSKIAQDFLGLQYHLSYGMHIVRVRPFNHIGPRLSAQFVVSAFAKQIAEMEKNQSSNPILKVGNLEAKRDFTDVRDVVKAYVSILEKGKAGEVYNIGSGESHKISKILDILLAQSDLTITVQQDPSLMRPVDIPDMVCNFGKLHDVTEWRPTIPLEISVKDTLDYWREKVRVSGS